MVEAAQVIPWWFNSQIWANMATVATGITAIVMVVFSGLQLRSAREERRTADDALASANEALGRAEQLEKKQRADTLLQFSISSTGDMAQLKTLILLSQQVNKLGGEIPEEFIQRLENARKKAMDLAATSEGGLELERKMEIE